MGVKGKKKEWGPKQKGLLGDHFQRGKSPVEGGKQGT